MFICTNCENDIKLDEEVCPACHVQNIFYCKDTNNLVSFGFWLGLLLGFLLYFLFDEIVFSHVIIIIITFSIFGYYYKKTDDYTEVIATKIIREKGNKLLRDKQKFSYKDISIACSWKAENTEETEKFNKWVEEVAMAEQWEMKNDEFYRLRT